MDYLRTLGSAAVSSLVQKSGLNLPFSLGAKVSLSEPTIWNLYEATKRDDGSPVSVFEYDLSDPTKKNTIPLAKNALRKLRTIRHPDVLKFMDAVETDAVIYIMTERIRPLPSVLQTWSSKGAKEKEDWLLWGLHRISVALAFVNDSCNSTHGNLRVNSIFISPSGEWKLGAFELLSNSKDDAPVLYTLGALIPNASLWASPEIKKNGWSVLKNFNPATADAYALGLVLHAVFNPSHPLPATAQPPHPPPQPSSCGAIPISVFPSFKKLLNPNPKVRLSPKAFLEIGMAQTAGEGSGFFVNNHLVKVCSGLDNFSLGSEMEKTALLKTLKESASSFPPEFASYRVLPSLISALEFGGASAAAILPLVLQLGKNVSPEDYPSVILSPLVKLFSSPDRGTRMALLDHLPEYADKLDKKAVADKIWPNLQTGFSDTVAVVREATVKSIILLAPNLSDRILNNDLLRFLAKMQTDPEASIRTNTCILIGRLGPSLGFNTKRKVLVPAFSRALKDTFLHARVASLMAFMATIDCFEVEELATKVIPNLSCAMVDKEKLVRDQAFKAVELFVKKLEQHAASMPDTTVTEKDDTLPGGIPSMTRTQATLATSAAGAAGALAGWAISSLGKKLVTADMQGTMASPAAGLERSTSAPPPAESLTALNPHRPSPLPFTSTLSAANYTHTSLATAIPTQESFPSSSRARGMQLGANKIPVGGSAALLAELADEIEGGTGNPWGSDDLIDVNADDDDWSAFESAPQPVVHRPQPVSAVNMSFSVLKHQNGNSSPKPDDPWGDLNPSPSSPHLYSTSPRKLSIPVRVLSPPLSRRSTPVSPLLLAESDSWDTASTGKKQTSTPPPSMSGMSKEDKAAEMARRKEERKQRIAQLKEQKKIAGAKG